MSFRERWRELARAAGRAPDPPLPEVSAAWLEHTLRRVRAALPHTESPVNGLAWSRPTWALLVFVAILHGLAVPTYRRAFSAAADLRFSLRDLPRPPAALAPPVPSPPSLPAAPLLPTSRELFDLVLSKETRP